MAKEIKAKVSPKPLKPVKAPKPKLAKPAVAAARPAAQPESAPAPAWGPGDGVLPISGLVERLTGSKLCYGEPIRDNGRTIVPVARVRAIGGAGFGRGPAEQGGGGGGGGTLDALPFGYIEIGPEGTRFQRIEDPEAINRAVRTVTAAAVTLATAFAGLRAARVGRRRLGRGR
ncbi:hypothetical protein [Capillimicrobium parvum]|uniref:Sporulation protein YtfJ n=1 Tax=Capillimicrobium parvum TaxID=2884022 RepID=A0A9E6Y2D5_9ACTN|nr:hypothetical protein [Capillimicrobium parvum]UGS38166.1 hypothetical protein DSM104329_04589 [Capillimicrobium parvum]